jgi:adenylate kinase family enzyme
LFISIRMAASVAQLWQLSWVPRGARTGSWIMSPSWRAGNRGDKQARPLLLSLAVERVSIVGTSGSGKSTLGKALAARIGAEFLELDSVFHQPGWVPLPDEEFRRRVGAAVAAERWVIDGNYSGKVRDLVWDRADTVVWLDLPRRTVMRRIIWRSFLRAARRTELWNGNREHWRNLVALDKEESVIVWAWTSHARNHARYAAAMADPPNSQLRFVRLTRPAEVRSFLASVSGGD